MKKIILFIILAIVSSLLWVNPVKAVNDNLISNPSVETADQTGLTPMNWLKGSWGQNTATFSYLNSGQDGRRSLKVAISSYTSGDAKWYFEPAAVLPNTQYFFSDYYQSSVPTDVVAQTINSAGAENYQYLGTNPVSSSWQKGSFLFTTPSNVSRLTIFHLLGKVGYLQTDNFVLKPYQETVTPEAIPNGSLEKVSDFNNNLPQSWQTGQWGQNKVVFSYLNTGHTGSRSIKVALSNRTSGDAKWYYTPQPVSAGQNYEFKDYYQANVPTEVILMVNKLDGTTEYITLATVGASTSWSLFSSKFVMPIDTKTASIMHVIYSNGYLVTDDYALSTYVPQRLNRPLITLTFDDDWHENLTTAFPILNQYGFKTTQYYATEYIETQYDRDNIKAIFNAGHEIGSHTVTHPFLTQVSQKKLINELTKSKAILESIVGAGNVKSFATPYGDYNANVTNAIKQYYQSNRNTDVGWNSKDNLDRYNIKVQNMTNTTTFTEFKSWVDKAKADNTWLVIVYHNVIDTPDLYDVKTTDFALQMQYVSQTGIAVETISQALAEVASQSGQ